MVTLLLGVALLAAFLQIAPQLVLAIAGWMIGGVLLVTAVVLATQRSALTSTLKSQAQLPEATVISVDATENHIRVQLCAPTAILDWFGADEQRFRVVRETAEVRFVAGDTSEPGHGTTSLLQCWELWHSARTPLDVTITARGNRHRIVVTSPNFSYETITEGNVEIRRAHRVSTLGPVVCASAPHLQTVLVMPVSRSPFLVGAFLGAAAGVVLGQTRPGQELRRQILAGTARRLARIPVPVRGEGQLPEAFVDAVEVRDGVVHAVLSAPVLLIDLFDADDTRARTVHHNVEVTLPVGRVTDEGPDGVALVDWWRTWCAEGVDVDATITTGFGQQVVTIKTDEVGYEVDVFDPIMIRTS